MLEIPPLPRKKYPCVVIDPPWSFGDRGSRFAPSYKGPKRKKAHYEVMSLAEVCLLPLEKLLRKDAWVFLWIPNSLRRDGTEHVVTRAWGLTLTGSEMVWVKTQNDGTGLRIGGGHYLRNAHESCLVAKRGKPRRVNAGVPSVVHAPRGQHSEKPEAFYDLVQAFCLGPYLDMFARKERSGWTGWGNQLPK